MKYFAVIDALYILQHKDPHRPDEKQGDELRIRCPECQGPASFNRRKLVGRCFHCDMTLWFDSSSNPDDLFDTPQTSHSHPQSAPVEAGPVAVDEHPLSEQAYAYLARRGLRRSTVDRFPITETLYNDKYPKLVWTNRQGGKELRALDDTPPWHKMTARGHPKDLTYVDRQSQTTVICESMLSAMSYAQLHDDFTSNYLIMNSIDLFESTLTYLEQSHAWTIILALDNDDPGRRTTARLQRQLRTRYTEIRFPVKKDWNDDLPEKYVLQSITSHPIFTMDKVREALAHSRQFDRQDAPGWQWIGHNKRTFFWSREIMRRHRDFLLALDEGCPASLQDITDHLTGGRQVFPWAAGCGKTTAIRQLICQEYARGVLYAVRTQAEADLLGYEIACFLIDQDGAAHAATPQDHKVYILHSAARVVDHDLDQEIYSYQAYCEDPERIRDFPVIVTTHARLFLDPPQLLLNMHEDVNPHGNPARQFMIIDEKPSFYEKVTLDIHDMDRFRQLTKQHSTTRAALQSLQQYYQGTDNELGDAFHDIAERLLQTLADRELDTLGLKRAYHRAATIVEARRDQTMLLTYNAEHEERYTFLYHLGLLNPQHLLLFDGTGDLTLKGSPYWSLCPNPKFIYKFRGTVHRLAIRAIPRHLDRLDTAQLALWKQECTVVLNTIIRNHQHVLLVTWKDLKGSLEYQTQATLHDTSGDDLPLDITESATLASHTYLPMYVLRHIIAPELQSRVHVTHYQAGDTRGTNHLKHCDAVIFLGRFYVHSVALNELNHVEQSQVGQEAWLLAEVVQATYRSRIRTGKAVDVYFSSDFDDLFINAFLSYTNAQDRDGHPLTCLTPATQLRQVLSPDQRSLEAYDFLASKADELLRGEVVEYYVPRRYLDASVRLDNFKRAIQRVVADKATYVDLGPRRFSVQLRSGVLGG